MTGTSPDTEYARLLRGQENAPIRSREDMGMRIATLKTSTTCVEVNEFSWTEPTALMFRVNRPVLTLLVSASTTLIETGYVGEDFRELNRIGGVIFVPPDREILSRSASGKFHIVACSFDREYSESVVGSFADLSRSQLLNCLSVRSSLLPSILLRLMNEAIHPGFVSTALGESLGQALLVECSHVILSKDSEEPQGGRLAARHFRIIDEYLAGLSCEAPSITAIAKLCGMSERHLSKSFRAQTNQSIGRYLRCVQISKAQAYLLETDLALKEVAYRLGFSTPANFSIAFRAATGQTPGDYRAGRSASPKTRTN
jgi:AraC family transcriptional regulator